MYATVAAAAALHQLLLRSLGEDKVGVQNVASGLFCVLFVALGVATSSSAGNGCLWPTAARGTRGIPMSLSAGSTTTAPGSGAPSARGTIFTIARSSSLHL